MTISYNPKDATTTWPDGKYNGVLEKVEDKYSQVGNPMNVQTFRAYTEDGREMVIKEYVTIPQGTYKIRQLAIALGRKVEFDAGTFQPEEHVGASLLLTLKTEEQAGYEPKNRIAKVEAAVSNGATQGPIPKKPIPGISDSDVPF